MALDNAQFISELSITDPTGTDPLNEGDDQIRTTKRATQQSFPNVDAPVPQTAAQMGQMAIKNEVNIFTVDQAFNAQIFGKAGGIAASPSYAFTGGGNTGMFSSAAGLLNFSVSGADLFNLQASRATFGTLVRGQDGSAATPAYSFVGETNTGMYQAGVQNLGFATVGVQRLVVSSAQVGATVPFFATNGSVSSPSYTFSSDPTMGMYRDTGGRISFGVGGTLKFLIQDALVQSQTIFRNVDGLAVAPAYTFTDQPGTGMYRPGTSIGFAVNGVDAAFLLQTQLRMISAGTEAIPAYSFQDFINTGINGDAQAINLVVNGETVLAATDVGIFPGILAAGDLQYLARGGLLADKPGFAFSNDSDTGMFRRAVNGLGFASAGLEKFNIGTGGIGVTSGNLCFFNLPTSPSTGGSLWNDAGTVKVA